MRKPICAICKHSRGLISTFVVRCLDSIISLVSIFETSVATQAGLSLTLSKTHKTGFLVTWINYISGQNIPTQ